MKLYYAPAACSQAPHIVAREAGLAIDLAKVEFPSKTTADGESLYDVNPKGAVPALKLDDGNVLTENAVILQYLADQAPGSDLAVPREGIERWRQLELLNFIATEIHKGFAPLWKPTTPDAYKSVVIETLGKRFDYLQPTLAKQPYLTGERFTVADAYLFTILNWASILKVDISKWPALGQYLDRVRARPGVQTALREEHLIKAAA
jgi:glutathione S-transferase